MMNLKPLFIFVLLVASIFAATEERTSQETYYPFNVIYPLRIETEGTLTANLQVVNAQGNSQEGQILCPGASVTINSDISGIQTPTVAYTLPPGQCPNLPRFNGNAPSNLPIRFNNADYGTLYNEAHGNDALQCAEGTACYTAGTRQLSNFPTDYISDIERFTINPQDVRAQIGVVCSLEGSQLLIERLQNGNYVRVESIDANDFSDVRVQRTLNTLGTYRIRQVYDIPGCMEVIKHPRCDNGNWLAMYDTDRTRDPNTQDTSSLLSAKFTSPQSQSVSFRILGRQESGFLGSNENQPNNLFIQRWGKGYVNFKITNTGQVPFQVTSASLQGSNGFDAVPFNMVATCNALRNDLGIQNCGYNESTCRALGFTNPAHCTDANGNGFNQVIQPGETRMLAVEVTPQNNLETGREYPFSLSFDKVISGEACNVVGQNAHVHVSLDYVAEELSPIAECTVTPSPHVTLLNENHDITIACRNTQTGQQINCGNDIQVGFSQGTVGVATPVRAGANQQTRVSTVRVSQTGQIPAIRVTVDGGAVGTYSCSSPIEIGAAPDQEPSCRIRAYGPDALDVERDGLAPGARATFYGICINARGERVDNCQLTWSSSNQNVLRTVNPQRGPTQVFVAQNQEGQANVQATGVDPDAGAFVCTPLTVNVNSQTGREESCELAPSVANLQIQPANPQYSQDYSILCMDAGGNDIPCLDVAWSAQGSSGVPPNLVPGDTSVQVSGNAEVSTAIIATERNAVLGVDVATCNAQLQVTQAGGVCGVQDNVCNKKECPQDPDCPRCDAEDNRCEQNLVCINEQGVRFPDPDCQTCTSISVNPQGGVVQFGQVATYTANCGAWPFQEACQNPQWDVQIDNPQSVVGQNAIANRLIVRAGQVQGQGTVSAVVDGFACRNTQPLIIQPACGPLDGICPLNCNENQDVDCDARNDQCAPDEVYLADGMCLQQCPNGFFPNADRLCVRNDDCGPGELFVNGVCVWCPGGFIGPLGICDVFNDEECPPGQVFFNGQCINPEDCPPGQICPNPDDEDPSVCRELRISSNQVKPGQRVVLSAICGGGRLCDNPRINNIDPDNFQVISRPGANPIEIIAGQSIGTSTISVRVGRSVCPAQPEVTVLPFVCRDFT